MCYRYNHLSVSAGVLDPDYRGPVKIVLFNHSEFDLVIRQGDKVAQLIMEKFVRPEVIVRSTLEDTVRGEQSFGSTGK